MARVVERVFIDVEPAGFKCSVSGRFGLMQALQFGAEFAGAHALPP